MLARSILPPRIPKAKKRASRWRSPAHCNWIRGFACCVCGSTTNIAAAHVRIGSGTGAGAKPDDWRTVPLCDGPWSSVSKGPGCHDRQHMFGERSFWGHAQKDPEALITAFIAESPKRREIEQAMRERGI